MAALEAAQPAASNAQFAPQVATGLATSGAGLLPTVGIEAALGAATTPETPWQGAAIGGALGAAGYALPGAVSRGVRAVNEMAGGMPSIGLNMVPTGAAPAQMVPPAARSVTGKPLRDSATGKILNAVDAATATPPTRVHAGLNTAEELQQYNIPALSAGDDMLLRATSTAERDAANLVRSGEDARGMAGGVLGDSWNQYKGGLTDVLEQQVKGRVGIPDHVALDDATIGSRLSQVGSNIGEIGRQAGNIRIGADDLTAMRELADSQVDTVASKLTQRINALEEAANKGGGSVSGDTYQQLHTKLVKMAETPELSRAAGKLMEMQEDALARNLNATQLEALKAERYKYRILMRLIKPGVRDAQNRINANAFKRSWKAKTSPKLHSADDLGKLAETIGLLTTPTKHTGNTLQRFIDAAPGAVQNNLGTAIGGAAGTAAVGGAANIFSD
jgi:hypothetical protein